MADLADATHVVNTDALHSEPKMDVWKERRERTYHDRFSQPDADIVLRSKDGTYFRVPSATLRMTSGFFRSTLSLPQPPSSEHGGNDDAAIVPLDENVEITAQLLGIICGVGIAPSDLASFAAVSALLHAAEKYEMPGVTACVRLAMTAPRFLADPLRLYALSCRYGWRDEAQAAATLTLSLDITQPDLAPTLATLAAPDLLRLLQLRWARHAQLKEALDGFSASREPYKCLRCNRPVDVHPWREWKWIILEEFSHCPSGASVLTDAFLTTVKANAVFQSWCLSAGCEKVGFDRELTLRNIRKCIEQLPQTIET